MVLEAAVRLGYMDLASGSLLIQAGYTGLVTAMVVGVIAFFLRRGRRR